MSVKLSKAGAEALAGPSVNRSEVWSKAVCGKQRMRGHIFKTSIFVRNCVRILLSFKVHSKLN